MLIRLCAGAVLALAVLAAHPVAQPRQVSLVITGGTVVTVDEQGRVLSPGAVAVDGNAIVAIDTPEAIAGRFTAADRIDATGHVVMPGLVNTHTHAPMVLYRGLADDLALMEWLEKYLFPAEAKTVSPAFVRTGTRLAALEMIQSGTTTFADMYYFEEEIARATKQAGLRGVLGQTIIQFPVADAKTPADALARAEAFIREWKNDDLITPALAPHAMYTLDAATLKAVRSLADREGVPVLIHLAETADEAKISQERHKQSPTQYLESLGFWSPSVGPGQARPVTVAAHAVWMDEADIATLRRRGIGVAHNPESNMKLASGTARVVDMRAAGITVGLGTDGAASNNDLDMFEAMRLAAFLAKHATGDPRAVPARAALEMATIEGARALGMGDRIGSLEPGKRADLIVVSMASARQTPIYDPLSHLVYATSGSDVRTTIVNGRILMRDRKMLTLDETAILAEASAAAVRVREAVR